MHRADIWEVMRRRTRLLLALGTLAAILGSAATCLAEDKARNLRPAPTKPYFQNPAPANPSALERQRRQQYKSQIERERFRQERSRAPHSARQTDSLRSLRRESGRLGRTRTR
jgi:hypothetical protein